MKRYRAIKLDTGMPEEEEEEETAEHFQKMKNSSTDVMMQLKKFWTISLKQKKLI